MLIYSQLLTKAQKTKFPRSTQEAPHSPALGSSTAARSSPSAPVQQDSTLEPHWQRSSHTSRPIPRLTSGRPMYQTVSHFPSCSNLKRTCGCLGLRPRDMLLSSTPRPTRSGSRSWWHKGVASQWPLTATPTCRRARMSALQVDVTQGVADHPAEGIVQDTKVPSRVMGF